MALSGSSTFLPSIRDTLHAVQPEELRGVRLLDHVALESAWGVLERSRVVELQPGEGVMQAGEPCETLYLVVSGSLRQQPPEGLGEAVSGPGAQVVGEGSSLGEMSLLEGTPAVARMLALEPTRLLAVDEESFWRLAGTSHAFALNVLGMLCTRLRERNAVATRSVGLEARPPEEAAVDGLTGLHARPWLTAMLPRYIGRSVRDAKPLSVMAIDVDHLRHYNDTYGLATGDRVLTAVGRIMRWCLRPSDQSVRFGGEEFCVVLPETDLAGARAAANRLRHTVAESQMINDEGGRLPSLTLSIGVAQLAEGADAEALLQAAATALAAAKKSGGNVACG